MPNVADVLEKTEINLKDIFSSLFFAHTSVLIYFYGVVFVCQIHKYNNFNYQSINK